ncbi:TPA: chromosome partitioning protein ParB [Klebsiella pneumoniae]|nr:chromosome partitioning protein ParB [Klebsiella pneumoniae]HBT5016712.1 chromosome partitioning protein ParB [Klebsiella pneumoniae]
MTSPQNYTFKPLDSLILDPKNPRLPEAVARTPQAMLDYNARSTSIEDLMNAIAENDFFAGEPLIVMPELNRSGAETGKLIVIEGNRRLTALKLIQDPTLCSKPTLKMLDIAQNAEHKPTSIPVIIEQNRMDVLPYLGFRHITGVKQWEPLAKARYMEQIFNLTDASLSPNEKYIEVARTIGSRKDHIKRNLDALAVFKLIDENGYFDIPDLDEESIKFAVLSTALADERIGSFVGVTTQTSGAPVYNDPIVNNGVLNYEHVKELTHWLYEKDSKGRTKVGESRNIKDLAAVLTNESALTHFRNGASLKLAYEMTGKTAEDFMELMLNAENSLREAAGIVATVQYEASAVESAKRMNAHIKLIHSALIGKLNDIDDLI